MNFLSFQKTFNGFPIVPVRDVEKVFPDFDPNALTRWQKMGYIEKIRNGYYRFNAQVPSGESELFFIANRIYSPSYISLQSALCWYGLIPEQVFSITSATTLKTQRFQTPRGQYLYQHLKPELFFGYRLEAFGKYHYKIADPAKALLDLLYLNPILSDAAHFHELRFNFFEIQEQFSVNDFEIYLKLFNSKSLLIRAKNLLNFLSSHDAIV